MSENQYHINLDLSVKRGGEEEGMGQTGREPSEWRKGQKSNGQKKPPGNESLGGGRKASWVGRGSQQRMKSKLGGMERDTEAE